MEWSIILLLSNINCHYGMWPMRRPARTHDEIDVCPQDERDEILGRNVSLRVLSWKLFCTPPRIEHEDFNRNSGERIIGISGVSEGLSTVYKS